MKKFLSLALALVMALSLVTISAGAKEFKDDSSIKYDEAVAVISAIGVVDGDTDGSFRPQDNLSRGAAAKIICNLILGPTTASALPADTAPFKDVPANHTFAGYIAYCAQQGIINGYSDGSFRPSDTLDGYSFMKMLLGALGYDGSIEFFTGGNWSTNVAKLALANGIDLADGNDDFVGSKAVTREEACLYAFNTLQADMVGYDSKTSVSVGGAEVVITGSKAKVQEQGVYKDTMDEDGLQFAEKYFGDLKKDDTSDDFGRPATTWKLKNDEVGTYPSVGDLAGTSTKKVTKASVYNTIGKSIYDDLKDGKASLKVYIDGALVNYNTDKIVADKDGNEVTVKGADDVSEWIEKNNTGRIGNTVGTNNGNGTKTEIYVDDDSNTTIVMVNTYVFQATEDYNSSKEEVKVDYAGDTEDLIHLTKTTLDIDDSDDFDIEGVKEDDYILINAVKVNGGYEAKIATVAEQISGTVDSYAEKDSATVDGTDYSYAATTNSGVQGKIVSADTDVTLVLDSCGFVIAVDEATGTRSYVFITGAEQPSSLSSTVKANAYFMDGTNAEITLKKITDKDIATDVNGKAVSTTKASDLVQTYGWYTYSKDSNDKYTLTAIAGGATYDAAAASINVNADLTTNGKTTLYTVNGVSVKANADTVFVIEDEDGDISVYTGIKNVPDTTLTKDESNPPAYATMGYVYKKDTGYATYVFIGLNDTNAKVDDTTSDESYVFIIKLDKPLGDKEDSYFRYKAIVDGEETKILTDDDGYSSMTLYSKIKTSASTGRITDMKPVSTGEPNDKTVKGTLSGKITYSAGILSMDGSYVDEKGNTVAAPDYSVDSETEIILIVDRAVAGDGSVAAVMTDKGADYEIGSTSASSLKSTFAGYNVTGEFYAVTDDDYTDSDSLDYLFVYVDSIA